MELKQQSAFWGSCTSRHSEDEAAPSIICSPVKCDIQCQPAGAGLARALRESFCLGSRPPPPHRPDVRLRPSHSSPEASGSSRTATAQAANWEVEVSACKSSHWNKASRPASALLSEGPSARHAASHTAYIAHKAFLDPSFPI